MQQQYCSKVCVGRLHQARHLRQGYRLDLHASRRLATPGTSYTILRASVIFTITLRLVQTKGISDAGEPGLVGTVFEPCLQAMHFFFPSPATSFEDVYYRKNKDRERLIYLQLAIRISHKSTCFCRATTAQILGTLFWSEEIQVSQHFSFSTFLTLFTFTLDRTYLVLRYVGMNSMRLLHAGLQSFL